MTEDKRGEEMREKKDQLSDTGKDQLFLSLNILHAIQPAIA